MNVCTRAGMCLYVCEKEIHGRERTIRRGGGERLTSMVYGQTYWPARVRKYYNSFACCAVHGCLLYFWNFSSVRPVHHSGNT